MSDHVVQTIHDSDARVTKSMHPYQSIWMAHWMQTNCDSAVEISNHISPNGGSKEERCDSRQDPIHVQTYEPNKVTRSVVDEGPRNMLEHLSEWRHRQNLEVEFDIPEYGKGVEAVNEAERAVPRNKTPKMNLRSCKNAISGCKSFPIFNFNQMKESSLDSKNDPIVYGRHVSRSQFDGNTGQVAAMKGTCQPTENTPQISGHLVNSRKCLEKKSLPASRLFKDVDLMESRYNVMPYGFKSGGTPEQSLRCTTKETDWSIPGLSSKKHLENAKFCHDRHENPNYGSSSTSKLLACGNKEMDNHLNDRNCGNHYMVPRNRALQMHDPSTSGFTPPIFIGQQSKIHNFPCSEFLTSYGRSPGKMKLEELNYGCRSLERRPRRSIRDVETLRVCTTVGSVEGLPGAPSRFSQATQHLLITKKTDVNLSKGGQIIRESMVSTKFKQNAFHELFTLPFSFGLHGKGGAKLHSLGNSIFQQRNGIQDVKTDSLVLKNQLSAETDTMDMDIFHARCSLPGEASHPSKLPVLQDVMMDQAQEMTDSPKEIESIEAQKELFDINQEATVTSAAAGTMANRELSTSSTESLDVDHLLSHAKQLEDSTFIPHQNSRLVQEPDNRWIKRLKLSASDSPARGYKISKLGDASSSDSKLLGPIMIYGRTSLEPVFGEVNRKGQESDKAIMLSGNRGSSSPDLVKEYWDLSHSWLQRWCRNYALAPLVKPKSTLVGEKSTKVTSEEFQRKEFPSIAAMALMGKTMSSFHPCEFRKKRSFVLWNT